MLDTLLSIWGGGGGGSTVGLAEPKIAHLTYGLCFSNTFSHNDLCSAFFFFFSLSRKFTVFKLPFTSWNPLYFSQVCPKHMEFPMPSHTFLSGYSPRFWSKVVILQSKANKITLYPPILLKAKCWSHESVQATLLSTYRARTVNNFFFSPHTSGYTQSGQLVTLDDQFVEFEKKKKKIMYWVRRIADSTFNHDRTWEKININNNNIIHNNNKRERKGQWQWEETGYCAPGDWVIVTLPMWLSKLKLNVTGFVIHLY